MQPIDPRIIEFISEHHILTLAVTVGDHPWCATCYYAWQDEPAGFVVTSDDDTRHIRDLRAGGHFRVAGSVALETRLVGKIRGIQFSGTLRKPEGEELALLKKRYLRRFPIARMMPELHLWLLEPDHIKMTDNRLGFGKKLHWNP